MEKLVIRNEELADRWQDPAEALPPERERGLRWWVWLATSPLLLALPLLAMAAIVIRIIVHAVAPLRISAWNALLATWLTASALLTTAAVAVYFGMAMTGVPTMLSTGLSELDSRTEFAALPAGDALSPEDVARDLKPLVTVIAPASHGWLAHNEVPANQLGAGVILSADKSGYLIATARHVIDERRSGKDKRALVAAESGTWAGADVVARHKTLDLLLIWLPRATGQAEFTLPVVKLHSVKLGQPVFVIGHPQGLRYTLSTGIVSRQEGDAFQISAPISPGNSGGPLFDEYGRLDGIVIAMVDKTMSPNAENLNFCVRADALLDVSGWNFEGKGKEYLTAFDEAQKKIKE